MPCYEGVVRAGRIGVTNSLGLPSASRLCQSAVRGCQAETGSEGDRVINAYRTQAIDPAIPGKNSLRDLSDSIRARASESPAAMGRPRRVPATAVLRRPSPSRQRSRVVSHLCGHREAERILLILSPTRGAYDLSNTRNGKRDNTMTTGRYVRGLLRYAVGAWLVLGTGPTAVGQLDFQYQRGNLTNPFSGERYYTSILTIQHATGWEVGGQLLLHGHHR